MLTKQQQLIDLFATYSGETLYHRIIEMGRELPLLRAEDRTSDKIVPGCQSTMYLDTQYKDEKLYFAAYSEALISAGLAAILIYVYNGETPEAILKSPPQFLEDIGIKGSLTPSRANGLYSIHLRMKQDALKFIVQRAKSV